LERDWQKYFVIILFKDWIWYNKFLTMFDTEKKKYSELAQPSIFSIDDNESSQSDNKRKVGFKFAEDSIQNIIAYCFGSEEGEKKLKKIYDDASLIEDPSQKKDYIEKELRSGAKNIDDKIETGMVNGFEEAKKAYQQQIDQGLIKRGDKMTFEEAGAGDRSKDMMFNFVRSIGLNVDPENCKCNYQESPDGKIKCFTMTIVKRPTAQMQDENSHHNKVANLYADTLEGQEKQKFKEDIEKHQENAKNGQPKIPVSEFNEIADREFEKEFKRISQDQSKSTDSQKIDPEIQRQLKKQAIGLAKGMSDSAINGHIEPGEPIKAGNLGLPSVGTVENNSRAQ
jgi:hypothetical protein